MPSSLKDVEKLAQALAVEERAQLAESILASLQVPLLSEIATRWDQEIQARVAAYDRGETQTCAAEDVLAEERRLSR